MTERYNISHEGLKFQRRDKKILLTFLGQDDIDEEVIEGLGDKLREDVLTCKLKEMYAKLEKETLLPPANRILGSPALTPENGERLRLTKKIMDSYSTGTDQYRRGIFMYDILAGQYKLENQKGHKDASYRRDLKAIMRMQGDMNNYLYKKRFNK